MNFQLICSRPSQLCVMKGGFCKEWFNNTTILVESKYCVKLNPALTICLSLVL